MLSNALGKRQFRNAAMLALLFAFSLSGCAGEEQPGQHFALQPLGKVDEKLLSLMRRFVEVAYATPCNVMSPMDLPSAAFDPARRQYRADKLLSSLKARFLAKELFQRKPSRVIGVTEKDIYTRQMNFIFGLANLSGRFCVVSTARMHESFWRKPEKRLLLYRRSLKVLYHELGHTFGMRHCDTILCAMCYHNSLPELDAGYVWFCPACTQKLEKLAGPFPRDREARLVKLLTDVGLVEDAKRFTEKKGANP